MTPRKIIFINRFFYPDHSATSQMLSDLAFDLAQSGATVEIVTSRLRYDDPAAQLPAEETIDGVQVHRVWTSSFGRARLSGRALDYLTFYLSAAWMLWRHTNSNTVIVAKTDPPMISLVAAPVAWLRGATLVNWLQDLFPEVATALGIRIMRGPVAGMCRWLRNRTLHAARTNVVLGSRMAERVISLGISADKVHIIANWADGDAIRPVPREDNLLRKEWGLDGKFVVGYSGNLGRAHEFDTFLDAAELLQDVQEIVFLFIGAGAQRKTVETAVTGRTLQNVQFQPYQPRERLSQSLGVADVHLISLNPAMEGLIVPSKFYGIAAAGRTSLFVGDVNGEIPRVMHHESCGYTVATGESHKLENIIKSLFTDPALCQQLGNNARAMLVRQFDQKWAVEAWEEVLFRN